MLEKYYVIKNEAQLYINIHRSSYNEGKAISVTLNLI